MSVVLLFVFVAAGARAQGTVNFANTPTTLISTNNYYFSGLAGGAGNYRFGLYVAPFGSAPDTLLALATNGSSLGRFSGGDVAAGFGAGTPLSFQVRAWSSYAGATYEVAYAQAAGGAVDVLLGQSAVGFFTVPASGSVTIFGTGPGQVDGFTLVPLVPEPATGALVLIGLAAWGWRGFRRSRPARMKHETDRAAVSEG